MSILNSSRSKVACVAGGVVSSREITFWRQSRQASGGAARKMGRGTLKYSGRRYFPRLRRSLLAAPPPKLYFARAIPPATQARSKENFYMSL